MAKTTKAAKEKPNIKKAPKQIIVESPFVPHKYQQEVFRNWKRFNVIRTCRGWGKTVLAVMALDAACRKSKTPLDFAYIAPVKAQAWDLISPVVYEFLGHLENIDDGRGGVIKLIQIKDSAMEVHYNNGCKFKAYGADHPNNKVIRGKTFGGVVVDEFDSCSLEVWKKIIRPCLRKHKGWALLIGTIEPGSNLCAMAEEYAEDPDWQVRKYKFTECWQDLPAYDEDEYNAILKEYETTPNIFAREYECDETASDDDVAIPTNLIYAAQGKHIPESVYDGLAKIMGVDVATGGGQDMSCICKRQGLAVHDIKEYNLDNMELADRIAAEWNMFQPDAVFIDKGRGEGVISRLRQMGYNPIGIDFGGTALNSEVYADRRVEMYHAGIKHWLEQGGALPDDKKLAQELAVPCLKPTEGKLRMERKVDIKKKLNRSPDKADALALTFAAPVRAHNMAMRNDNAMTMARSRRNVMDIIGNRRHGFIR